MRSLFALRLALSLVFAPITMAFVHAGDVQVQVHGSTLLIQGSPKNDDFSITGNGDVVVVQAVGLGTTINGKSEVSIRDGASKNIQVDLGSGHDRCDIHQLSCLSLSVVDGLKTDLHDDKISLKDVDARSSINVLCFGGDDLVSIATVDAGLELKVGTGEGDDIAALYDVIAVDLVVTMGSGDDMVIAGSSIAKT